MALKPIGGGKEVLEGDGYHLTVNINIELIKKI